MIGGLKILTLQFPLHPELSRKLIHIGMGLVILSFPWIFDSIWPVLGLSGLSAVILILLRCLRPLREGVGSVLNGVNRSSWGEVYYPLAVGILFMLTQDRPLYFVIPILILSLADATAALVGVRYGRIKYATFDGKKSLEGSVGFLIVAFFSVHIPLLLYSSLGRIETILIAGITAVVVMMLEGISWQGLDNLFIPLGAYFLLVIYEHQSPVELVIQLLIAVILAVLALAWCGRFSLNDTALLGTGSVIGSGH